jgi:hypothetical protein
MRAMVAIVVSISPHYRRGILVFDHGEQQVLQRRIFMMALVGKRESPMKRLFKAAGERGHSRSSSSNIPQDKR